MGWLVLLHVLSAVLGLGPAYAFPFVMKKTKSLKEMQQTAQLVARLEVFPKVFGSLAVLSGLILFWLGSYGSWVQIWIIGTLIVYAATEVLVIGFLNPEAKRLDGRLSSSTDETATPETEAMYARVRSLHAWAGVLSLMIFILMIMKP